MPALLVVKLVSRGCTHYNYHQWDHCMCTMITRNVTTQLQVLHVAQILHWVVCWLTIEGCCCWPWLLGRVCILRTWSCGIHKIPANFTTFKHEMQLSAWGLHLPTDFAIIITCRLLCTGYSTDFRIGHAVFVCLSYIA